MAKRHVKDMVRECHSWKANRRIKVDAGAAAKVIEKVAKKHPEGLKPQYLVEEARNPRCPLHEEFTWDDSEAAELYRVQQAKYIIRSLVVTIETVRSGKTVRSQKLRSYTSLGKGETDGKDSAYHDTKEILSDAQLRKQVLLKIWRQLLNLKAQYEEYKEFAAVWAAVDEAQEEMVKIG